MLYLKLDLLWRLGESGRYVHYLLDGSALNETIKNRILTLIAYYERGVITESVLSHKIADYAVDPDFFQFLNFVPASVIPRLREIADRALAHPEDYLIGQSICAGPDFDFESHDREQRETAYWSARRLREYFYPNRPLPEFESFKLAGTVSESIEMDRSVVIFGDIQSYLFRENPII